MLLSRIKSKLTGKSDKRKLSPEKRLKLLRFVQKWVPLFSVILFIVGIGWILLLPYQGYNKHTYISENALLPGQVNLDYGYNDIRTAEDYRTKILEFQNKDSASRANFIHQEFRRTGFVSAIQQFDIEGKETGANVFAINRAPRSDGKEALVLSASWKSRTGEFNTNGIAALLSLAKLFKRNVYWAKDVILLVTDHGKLGTQVWLDAYHGMDQHDAFSSVVMPRSGAIQGVVNLDFPGVQDYERLGIFFEGVNGQLPNLDLINTIVAVAQRTSPPTLVTLHDSPVRFPDNEIDAYKDSLKHLFSSMKYLAIGHPSSDAGLYLRYTIDAVTIHGVAGSEYLGSLFGFQRIGRVVESTFRSLNNLLEHFHQSFFFYLLLQPTRYVSISQYMPPVIIFACALVFQSLSLYYLGTNPISTKAPEKEAEPPAFSLEKHNTVFGFSILTITHITGTLIFNLMQPAIGSKYFSQLTENNTLLIQFGASILVSILSTLFTVFYVSRRYLTTKQDGDILKSFCLAQSALVIATVSLLNFGLGVVTAVAIVIPYSFIRPTKHLALRLFQIVLLVILSPAGLIALFSVSTGTNVADVLATLMSDYEIVRSWFLTFICTVYWPINMAMMTLVFSTPKVG
ncbi:Gaa1-domain-containing protein [Backusella circina FSU 941]|nr:Gaa1-domain-containing protein [Backusella circina FSU 941]